MRLSGACCAVALLLCGCGSGPEGGPPKATPVSAATVIAREITEWDDYTGRLEAVESVEIRPRVSGYIERVELKEGKEIKRGDLLFVIDQRPYLADLARANADYEKARTQLALARSDLQRGQSLLKTRAMSQEEYDQRVAAARTASASLASAAAAVQVAKLNVDYSRITSPIDGRVGRALVTRGNLVTGGNSGQSTLLTTVVSLDPVYVYFDAAEAAYLKYVGMARRGERASSRDKANPVVMELQDESNYPHAGVIDFVDNHIDPNTGTIRGRAIFKNADRFFTPGQFVRLRLLGSGTYQALLITDRAVGTDQDRKFVLVVDGNNKAEYRTVSLGPIVDNLRVVRSGLKAGDRVIINGMQHTRPGTLVAPTTVPMA